MTEKAEFDRVRFIHRYLDNLVPVHAAEKLGNVYLVLPERFGTGTLVYTAAEIAAWPSTKALLHDKVRDEPDATHAVVGDISRGLIWWCNQKHDYDPRYVDAIARGLCLYREMQGDFSRQCGEWVQEPAQPGPKRADPLFPEVKNAVRNEPKRADPYKGGYDKERFRRPGVKPENFQRWETDAMSVNEVARLRNVAALKAEMDRPLPQKHPSEGRSDRVYRSNER